MAIPEETLKKMNEMLEHGSTIADIWRAHGRKYDYEEIYGSVSNYSVLGAKRRITNRLNRLQYRLTKPERQQIVAEIKADLETVYNNAKSNGKKIANILKTLNK